MDLVLAEHKLNRGRELLMVVRARGCHLCALRGYKPLGRLFRIVPLSLPMPLLSSGMLHFTEISFDPAYGRTDIRFVAAVEPHIARSPSLHGQHQDHVILLILALALQAAP